MTETTTEIAATDRGAALAAQLDAVNEQVIAIVAACGEEQWRRRTVAEGWPVGVVAAHVAPVQQAFVRILGELAAGSRQPAVMSGAAVDQTNARHARERTGAGQADTLATLRATGGELGRLLRGFDDARLDEVALVFDGNEMTAAQVVELGLIGHFQEHLDSVRATLAD